VPWNIVAYNVFGGAGKGPNIYGTEPWHFYVRNLFLNFNIWFLLALLSMPLLIFQQLIRKQPASRQSFLRNVTFLSPFYLWLAIFTLQPHKEERFMYPAYPLLALNAAISLHILLTYLGSADPAELVSKIPARLKFAGALIVVIVAVDLGLLRTAGLLTAYSAPLKVYEPLKQPGVAQLGNIVCLGKEWYRFPSSYFLPDGMKAKFVKSAFNGLLPGEFSEANVGFGFFPGAWLEPAGMNDENLEDLGKYVSMLPTIPTIHTHVIQIDIDHCTFIVDSYTLNSTPSELEPAYIRDTKTWEALACEPFLDHSRTGVLGRLLWIPDSPLVPERFQRKWGQYCLLRRKSPR
jgi:alpha-1,2-mannosyltransferase